MSDAHAPRDPRFWLTADDDVPAGIDPVVPAARGVDQPGGLLDRPALDESGRVAAAISAVTAGIEGTAGHGRKVVAGSHHVPNVQTARLQVDLSSREPADLAVRAIGAEPGVDVAQLLHHLVEDRRFDQRLADVDADGRAHEGFDAAHRPRPRDDHPRPAWSSAAWSEFA